MEEESKTSEVKKVEEEFTKLYKSSLKVMQIHFGTELIVFVEGRYKATKRAIVDFLDKELDCGNRSFYVAQDQNEEIPKQPGSDLELRNQQIRQFLADQNAKVIIPDSVDATKLNLTSSADSPTTGGQNPVAPHFTKVDTVQLLKDKLLAGKVVGTATVQPDVPNPSAPTDPNLPAASQTPLV